MQEMNSYQFKQQGKPIPCDNHMTVSLNNIVTCVCHMIKQIGSRVGGEATKGT